MNLKHRYLQLPLVVKILIPCLFIGLMIFAAKKILPGSSKVTYQTATVEKGTLMNSISASGTITSGDTTYITTGASGTVSKVYVKNGDTVVKGQKLAEIDLDDIGQETQTTAWNNYQEAQVSVKTALTQKETDSITMLQKKQAMVEAENAKRDAHSGGWSPETVAPYTDNELTIVDMQYDQAIATYQAAISNSSISGTNIALANAKASAAYRSYQQVSRTVISPASGILNNLTLAPGVTIGNAASTSITVSSGTDSTSNSVSVSSQKIGAIKNPLGQYQATVTLTEVDVTSVLSDQKVTLTLDAFPDKSLTGTVLAVNTSGSVSQGVTSYTATILLDKTTLDIFTNMAVSADIITSTKTDVILVPSSAVQISPTDSYVQIQKDGKIIDVTVEIGDSNDTQTEIISGLSEGETVISSVISNTPSNSTNTRSSETTSPFGGTGSFGGSFQGRQGF